MYVVMLGFVYLGNVVVGKITYSRQEILGHGSEGTIVFRLVVVEQFVNNYGILIGESLIHGLWQ